LAHHQQFVFFHALAQLVPAYFADKKVLEVGSLDINGSIRQFFTGGEYLGVDLGNGPGVDLVGQGQLLDFPTAGFDVVASAECFEHNPFWLETFANMLRMSKEAGLVIFSCASTGRPEHGTPRAAPGSSPLTVGIGSGYYRNLTAEDFTSRFHLPGWFETYHFYYCPLSFDLYFFGIRRPVHLAGLQQGIAAFDAHLQKTIGAYKTVGYHAPSAPATTTT
jgi:SAM-dependent methyltransferase